MRDGAVRVSNEDARDALVCTVGMVVYIVDTKRYEVCIGPGQWVPVRDAGESFVEHKRDWEEEARGWAGLG